MCVAGAAWAGDAWAGATGAACDAIACVWASAGIGVGAGAGACCEPSNVVFVFQMQKEFPVGFVDFTGNL